MLPEGNSPFKLILCDPAPDVLEGWKSQFLKWPEVELRSQDVLDAEADAFLLPGNAFGFLDGGLALRTLERFGWEIEEELRQRIRREFSGELLVGQSIVLYRPPLPRPLVYTPIWRTPRRLSDTVNVFLALRGALSAVKSGGPPAILSLAVPGMGINPGGLDPRVSARQMRYAFEMETGRRGLGDKNLSQLARRELKLQAIPGADNLEAGESAG